MNKKKIRKLNEDYSYEEIYDQQIKNLEEFENLRIDKNYVYIVKTITSGKIVEKEIYPIWKWKSNSPRGEKKKTSSEKMEKLNKKNKAKNTVRLVNTNFTERDLYITLTYWGKAPDGKAKQKE